MNLHLVETIERLDNRMKLLVRFNFFPQRCSRFNLTRQKERGLNSRDQEISTCVRNTQEIIGGLKNNLEQLKERISHQTSLEAKADEIITNHKVRKRLTHRRLLCLLT